MSMGYAMNERAGALGMNERGQALAGTVFRTLGYRRPDRGGIWYLP